MAEVTPENIPVTPSDPPNINALAERIRYLENVMEEHTRVMTDVRTLLGEIKNHVEPTIEALSKSPLGKMMGL
jgi:hypothetical protein